MTVSLSFTFLQPSTRCIGIGWCPSSLAVDPAVDSAPPTPVPTGQAPPALPLGTYLGKTRGQSIGGEPGILTYGGSDGAFHTDVEGETFDDLSITAADEQTTPSALA
jgi:hypothetical protein